MSAETESESDTASMTELLRFMFMADMAFDDGREKIADMFVKIHDELLFKQPVSSCYGDCPICFLPLPIDPNHMTTMPCCCKTICEGCNYANQMREIEAKIVQKCAFCRKPIDIPKKELVKQLKNRADKNDPVAMRQFGIWHYQEGDYQTAFEYLSKAAELGEMTAHDLLAGLYRQGNGVEKDKKKEWYHLVQAAIGGHPEARYNLGLYNLYHCQNERAAKHFIIAAKLGHDTALERLKQGYKVGAVKKDDLAAAFRGHQAAVDATKSPQREEAAESFQDM